MSGRMKLGDLPWRKMRNAVMFACLGILLQEIRVLIPCALAVWAWIETDDSDDGSGSGCLE